MAINPSTPGMAIRVLRKSAGLSIAEAAHSAGVSASQLSRVETGAARPSDQWTAVVVEAIAKNLASKNSHTSRLSA